MIFINEEKRIFNLRTENTEYVFGLDNENLIRHIYWGNKINNENDFEMRSEEHTSELQSH